MSTEIYLAKRLDVVPDNVINYRVISRDVALTSNPNIPDLDTADMNLPAEYKDRLHEINDTFRQIIDPKTGTAFEIAETNTHISPDETDMEIATYRSSISGNVGNAAEFALHSLANPDRRRMYVASIGNGGTDPFTYQELKYYSDSGRMTQGSDRGSEALPTIEAMHRALQAEKLNITRMSTDSFGGTIATAYAVACEPGQISHVYMKGKPNISGFSLPRLIWRMMIRENIFNNRHNQSNSTDPWALTPGITREVKALLPRVYSAESKSRLTSSSGQLIAYANGIRRGARSRWANPAEDIVAAISKQPNAKFILDMPDKDLLYKSLIDREKYLMYIAGRITIGADISRLLGLISEGSHGAHTYEPQKRMAMEQYAFSQ